MSITLTPPARPPREWNATDRAYPDTYVHEGFAAQVARSPAAPAVRSRDEALTYAELDARVGRAASRLMELGVGPGSLVAVCMERSVDMVVVLHAILRAGGAYVPIDPELPDERIDHMLEDCDHPLLVAQEHLAARLIGSAATVVRSDGLLQPSAGPRWHDRPRVSPEDLAYVIHTSGSTGRPKGVMIPHRAIANRMHWLQEYFSLTPTDRVLLKTPFSFDPSVWQFFWPLMIGAELVVAEPGGHRDTAYLTQAIVEHGITTIHFVPSMLQLFLEDPRARECGSLKRVICSGEVLSRTLQDRFFSLLDAELHNLYGPSEAIGATAWRCDPRSELRVVPVGKPVANTQLHILDERLQSVPVGTVGEIHIGGVQVGRGYLARPELTAERFIDDPFRPGGMLYRSGDLGRYLPDGSIEFLGRNDFQVKIRGNRVELGEIEVAIGSLDHVRGAVVVAHEREGGDVELAAYVVCPEGQALRGDEIRASLAERLPDYMVPTTVIGLERFPLTPHGKVDRRALPPPVRVRPRLDRAFVAPRTELQRDIAERWCRLLNLDRVGIHDRFFELGGTSLQAARFVIEMQTELNESIFVHTLFEAPSIAQYAAYLEHAHPHAVARRPGVERRAAPMSAETEAPQERIPHRRGSRHALSRQRRRRSHRDGRSA